jgi:hypothetical protein
LNKPAGYRLKPAVIIQSDSICFFSADYPYDDSCYCNWKSISSDFNNRIEYLEKRRVVRVDSIFYIKQGITSRRIYRNYVNKVVRF